MQMFDKIAIVGVGLIGSSLGRALMYKKLAGEVVGLVRRPDMINISMKAKCLHRATLDAKDAISDADAIIIATPLSQYENVMAATLPYMKKNAIVSDVGSAKTTAIATIEKAMQKHHRPDINIIPAHPIAGTELSGAENGMAHLFQDMFCIITPPEKYDQMAYDKIVALWSGIGAKVEKMTIAHHDDVLAITSHIPHLIAYSITGTARNFENQPDSREVIKYSAGGWRDFTRIAASDPVMWRDIFLANKHAMLYQLQSFQKDLQTLCQAIDNDDGAALENWFAKTREIRKALPSVSQLSDDKKQRDNFYDRQ
ncbi:MAG: prephenate dehydrogenase/arogenate dehydrogenase family protein [Alphaproteobacteria bacterium]